MALIIAVVVVGALVWLDQNDYFSPTGDEIRMEVLLTVAITVYACTGVGIVIGAIFALLLVINTVSERDDRGIPITIVAIIIELALPVLWFYALGVGLPIVADLLRIFI